MLRTFLIRAYVAMLTLWLIWAAAITGLITLFIAKRPRVDDGQAKPDLSGYTDEQLTAMLNAADRARSVEIWDSVSSFITLGGGGVLVATLALWVLLSFAPKSPNRD